VNDYQYQLIGESIWNTYRDIAIVFLEAESAEEHADIITKKVWRRAHEKEIDREDKKWKKAGYENPNVSTLGTRFGRATPQELKTLQGVHHVGAREGQVAGRRRAKRLAQQAASRDRIGVVGVGLRNLGRRIRGALA